MDLINTEHEPQEAKIDAVKLDGAAILGDTKPIDFKALSNKINNDGILSKFGLAGLSLNGLSDVGDYTKENAFIESNGRCERLSEKLNAGDHTIQFANGRQFLVHVPKHLTSDATPVMFVFPGAVGGSGDPTKFVSETAMNEAADKNNFITVYPLPKKHLLAATSKHEAYAWNTAGVMLSEKDILQAGYDDKNYVKGIVDLIPKITKSSPSHENWGAVGFSQGGLLLNKLITDHAFKHTFPTVALVASSMEEGQTYKPEDGNANNTVLVFNQGDDFILPEKNNRGVKFGFVEALRHVVDGAAFNELGAIRNDKQDPALQRTVYEGRLGKEGKDFITSTAQLNANGDTEKDFHNLNKSSQLELAEYFLPKAKHGYPGLGESSGSQPKYRDFDATEKIVKLFEQYNQKIGRHLEKRKKAF